MPVSVLAAAWAQARARLPARDIRARRREQAETCESASKVGRRLLYRRLPQRRGFTAVCHKEYAVVNLNDLERFEAGTEVTADLLVGCGVVKKVLSGVKILGYGELTKSLTVKAP